MTLMQLGEPLIPPGEGGLSVLSRLSPAPSPQKKPPPSNFYLLELLLTFHFYDYTSLSLYLYVSLNCVELFCLYCNTEGYRVKLSNAIHLSYLLGGGGLGDFCSGK